MRYKLRLASKIFIASSIAILFGCDSDKNSSTPELLTFHHSEKEYLMVGQIVVNTTSNHEVENIKYTSSNENVANVSDTGVVTAISEGSATISASSGESTAYWDVEVAQPYPMTVWFGEQTSSIDTRQLPDNTRYYHTHQEQCSFSEIQNCATELYPIDGIITSPDLHNTFLWVVHHSKAYRQFLTTKDFLPHKVPSTFSKDGKFLIYEEKDSELWATRDGQDWWLESDNIALAYDESSQTMMALNLIDSTQVQERIFLLLQGPNQVQLLASEDGSDWQNINLPIATNLFTSASGLITANDQLFLHTSEKLFRLEGDHSWNQYKAPEFFNSIVEDFSYAGRSWVLSGNAMRPDYPIETISIHHSIDGINWEPLSNSEISIHTSKTYPHLITMIEDGYARVAVYSYDVISPRYNSRWHSENSNDVLTISPSGDVTLSNKQWVDNPGQQFSADYAFWNGHYINIGRSNHWPQKTTMLSYDGYHWHKRQHNQYGLDASTWLGGDDQHYSPLNGYAYSGDGEYHFKRTRDGIHWQILPELPEAVLEEDYEPMDIRFIGEHLLVKSQAFKLSQVGEEYAWLSSQTENLDKAILSNQKGWFWPRQQQGQWTLIQGNSATPAADLPFVPNTQQLLYTNSERLILLEAGNSNTVWVSEDGIDWQSLPLANIYTGVDMTVWDCKAGNVHDACTDANDLLVGPQNGRAHSYMLDGYVITPDELIFHEPAPLPTVTRTGPGQVDTARAQGYDIFFKSMH